MFVCIRQTQTIRCKFAPLRLCLVVSKEGKLIAYFMCLKVGAGGMQNEELVSMGIRIHFLRNKCGYSKEELAEKLDITWQHLSNIEKGRRGVSTEVLLRLREIFHVSIDYLLVGNDTINNDKELESLMQNLDPAIYPHAVDLVLSLIKIYNDIRAEK